MNSLLKGCHKLVPDCDSYTLLRHCNTYTNGGEVKIKNVLLDWYIYCKASQACKSHKQLQDLTRCSQAFYKLFTSLLQAIYKPFTSYLQASYNAFTSLLKAIHKPSASLLKPSLC